MCEMIDMLTFYQQITDGQLKLSSVSSMSTGFSWRKFISSAQLFFTRDPILQINFESF